MFNFALFLNTYAFLIYLFFLLLYLGTSSFGYWKRQKIKYKTPMPFLGNFTSFVLLKKAFHEIMHDLYEYFGDDPFGGFYQMREPILLVKDPELVHHILVKDFKNFCDRGFDFFFPHKDLNPLSMNLFLANGDEWRSLRKKLTSIFTPSKLKPMQTQIFDCVNKLNSLIEKDMVSNFTDQDLKLLYEKLTIDVIGSCAFGIECNSLEKNNEFTDMGYKSLKPSLTMSLKLFVSVISKKLPVKLKLLDFPHDVTTFFQSVVTETILYRRKNGIKRADLLQLLMDLQNSYIDPKYAPPVTDECIYEEGKNSKIVAL